MDSSTRAWRWPRSILLALALAAVLVTSGGAASSSAFDPGAADPGDPADVGRDRERLADVVDLLERDSAGAHGRAADGAADRVGEFTTAGVVTVTDPRFDVFDGRADILAAAMEMDGTGTTILGLVVDIGTNPYNDDWVIGYTAATWSIDVTGDDTDDFFALVANDGVFPFAAVARMVDDEVTEVVCEYDPGWDVDEGLYGMVVPTSCFDNPSSARWRAAMIYDDVYGVEEVDFAPDVGLPRAGPVANAAHQAPAPDPEPDPEPGSDPAPNPEPAPTPAPPTSAACPSPSSASSASTTPIITVNPARVFDTRVGGTAQTGGSIARLQVAGCAGVPTDAAGAVLNVTALDARGPGYLSVFPCDGPVPDASNVNFSTGQTVPNTAVSKLDPDGRACVYSSAETGLIVDVAGYLPAESDITVQTPARFHDTRTVGVPAGGGTVTEIPIAGRFGAPADPSAVILNVTALDASAPGFLTVFPCGGAAPDASNVNYTTGQTVPNAVIARVASSGSVCVYTSATTGLIVDVSGFVPAGSDFAAVDPARMFDSRVLGRRTAGSITEVQITGRAGIPTDAATVNLNVTALAAAAPGYLTVFPCGSAVPDASNVNYTTDETVPNAAVAKIGEGGRICIYTSVETGLLVDAAGYAT